MQYGATKTLPSLIISHYNSLLSDIKIQILQKKNIFCIFMELYSTTIESNLWPGFQSCLFKKWIRFLEGSWNREYFGLLQETWSIHNSMNLPKIEFIAYINILLWITNI